MNNETITNGIYATTDLAFAAYLQLNALEITKIERPAKGNKFTFVFLDPSGQAEELSYNFLRSESKRFDDAVRSLKTLCHTKKQN